MTRSTYGFCQGDRGGVRDVRQSHGVDGAVDGGVEGGIPVVQQNRSPRVPRECLPDLLLRPGGRGVGRHVDVENGSAVMGEEHQDE